jgi:hypothetical protein
VANQESNQGESGQNPGSASAAEGSAFSPARIDALDRFADSFAASARRWELVVYPALFAFILLAAYGFFLVFSLTRDMRTLAVNVDPEMAMHMDVLADRVHSLSTSVDAMRDEMVKMAHHTDLMTKDMAKITKTMDAMHEDMVVIAGKMDPLEPILANMVAMNSAMHAMTANTGVMTRDANVMTYQFGRPMSFFNSFMPW